MAARNHPRKHDRPGRPVTNPDRDARELLLTAATELFAEHGVAATSFTTIAKRAKLTPAMMHYYFDDRDQLMNAVVEERLLPVIAYVWDPVKPGDDPADMIRGVVQRLVSGIGRAPWVPSTWMREILNEGGLLRGKVLRRIPVDKVRMVGEAIRSGQARQALNPDLDPLLVVFSALGLVMLHMATIKVWAEIFHRPALNAEAMRRHITGLLLDGLRHTPRPIRRTIGSKRLLRRKP
jgi:TetR/AcrR family transcriptional regulator